MRNIESLKADSIPLQGNTQGVYFLFDGDALVYIGIGWNCLLRVAEHTRKDSDKVFTSWNFVPVEDEKTLKEIEATLIKKYRPKYNVTHKDRLMDSGELMRGSSGKSCSICGEWKPMAAFEYGNRENRSYCVTCNKEESAAYRKGGKEAAREFRERKRRESGM